jgi:hypothetical protein
VGYDFCNLWYVLTFKQKLNVVYVTVNTRDGHGILYVEVRSVYKAGSLMTALKEL